MIDIIIDNGYSFRKYENDNKYDRYNELDMISANYMKDHKEMEYKEA